MRLGLLYGFSHSHESLDLVLEAERLGYDSVWTGEAWGSDTIVPLAWLGALTRKIRLGTAIMQMPARTPAMTAMTAMTLDAMSGGRFILGIGPSGPQVVEGWHGVPYGKPLARLSRVHSDPAKDPRARSAAGVPGLRIPDTCTGSGLDRPWQTVASDPAWPATTWKSTWPRSPRAAWRSQPKSPTG